MNIPLPPHNHLHCTTGDHDFYVIHGVIWYSTTTWRADPDPGQARALLTTITCAACATAEEALDDSNRPPTTEELLEDSNRPPTPGEPP